MNKLEKIFTKTNISWKNLIIYSSILGIVIGILKRIPILNNTSFQDIAIIYDMWIILAIFIIMNCKNAKEAMPKCFVFFLISQPLIYLTQLLIDVFINNLDFIERFKLYFINYYIYDGWLLETFLTIPGAYIAYQVKKENILSSIILSVATLFLALRGTTGILNTFLNNFPYHLISNIISLTMAYILIFILLKNKKARYISLSLTTLGILIGIIIFITETKVPMVINDIIDFEEEQNIIEVYSEDTNIATAILNEEKTSMEVYSSKEIGTTNIIAKDINGEEYKYEVTSTSRKFEVKKAKDSN